MPFLIFYKIYDIIYIDRKEKRGKRIGTIERGIIKEKKTQGLVAGVGKHLSCNKISTA